MKIYHVINVEEFPHESSRKDILFPSDDLNKAIEFAKKSIFREVMHDEIPLFCKYYNIYTNKGYLFKKQPYESNETFVVAYELNQPIQDDEIVWIPSEEDVLEMFSNHLDTICKEEALPVFSCEEKNELWTLLLSDTNALSEQSKYINHKNLPASSMVALLSENEEFISLSEQYES